MLHPDIAILPALAAPLITGGLQLLGGILSGKSSASAQDSANQTNIALQKSQQDWEERMSNTAYQRATTDMEAAGLNKALAYSQGGASTPNVAAAHIESTGGGATGGAGEGLKNAGTSAYTAMVQQQQIELMKAQARDTNASAMVKEASIPLPGQPQKLTTAQTAATEAAGTASTASAEQSRALAEQARQQLNTIQPQIDALKAAADKNRADTQTLDTMRQVQLQLAQIKAYQDRLGNTKAETEAAIAKALKPLVPGQSEGWTDKAGGWISDQIYNIQDAFQRLKADSEGRKHK